MVLWSFFFFTCFSCLNQVEHLLRTYSMFLGNICMYIYCKSLKLSVPLMKFFPCGLWNWLSMLSNSHLPKIVVLGKLHSNIKFYWILAKINKIVITKTRILQWPRRETVRNGLFLLTVSIINALYKPLILRKSYWSKRNKNKWLHPFCTHD